MDKAMDPKATNKNKESKTLVIVPKVDQSCHETRADLLAKLDPRKQLLFGFRNGRSGQVYVQCTAQVNFNDIRKDVETILFIMYKNDMKQVLNSCEIKNYASFLLTCYTDTVMFIAHKDIKQVESFLNLDLNAQMIG